MTSEDIKKRRLKDLVEELDNFRGRHTELVSVYVPAGFNLFKVVEQINNEKSTAQNIKSKSVRKNVMSALERITQHLKLYKQTPPNGLVVFAGNISQREGVADIEIYALEPPEPLNQRLYWCDQKFILDPLKEMIREREIFGIVIIDKSEADIGILHGKKVKLLKHLDSLVPGKTEAGGWCVHGDTLMQLPDGRIRKIKDIGEEEFMCYNFKKLAHESGKHNHYFERTAERAYEITTKAPTVSIKTTPEHKFFVPNKSGFEEKSAEELREGDSILLSKRLIITGKKHPLEFEIPITLKLKDSGRRLLLSRRKSLRILQREAAKAIGVSQTAVSKFELGIIGLEKENLDKLLKTYGIEASKFEKNHIKTTYDIKFPKYIVPDLAKFLGYVMGDGNRDESRICISESEEEVARKYKKMIEMTFGVSVTLRFRDDKKYWILRVNSAGLLDIVGKLFPEVIRSYEKAIPEMIYSLPNKELSGFLRGFFDAEGWINEGSRQIGIATNIEHAMRSVQIMLLRFGVISSLRKMDANGSFAKKQRYCVRITDYESLRRFDEKIGFTSSKKSALLKRILTNASGVSYCDQIPVKGSHILSLAHKLDLTTDDFQKTQDFFFDKKNMSYRIFRQNILPVFRKRSPNSKITKFLENIVTSELISVRIVSKKAVKPEGFFYDMEVPVHGNFIGNGIVLHNSQARYARVREGLLNDFMKKAGEVANHQFSEQKDMIGVIVGGPGPVKDTFANGDFLRYDFKKKIISIADISYMGEYGLEEAVNKSEEALKEAGVMKEKTLMTRFFNELGKDSGLAIYGLKETVEAVKAGTVETLIVSSKLDLVKAKVKCPKCGEEKDVVMQRRKLESLRCPNDNELYEILAEKDLTDEMITMAEQMGTNVEMISDETKEGSQLKEMGGVGGLLRYKSS